MASSLTGYQGHAGPSGMNLGVKIPGHNLTQLQNFTPQQMALFSQMFKQLGPDSFLSRLAGGGEEMFQEMELPALRQFAGLQGNLASRFSGMGMGGQKSSGFQNSMNQAASDFAMNLQSQRQSLQQQAIKDLMGLSGELLQQRPYESIVTQKPQKKSFFSDLMTGLGGAKSLGFF